MIKIFTCLTVALALFGPNLLAQNLEAEQLDKFLLLAASRTGTMEKELNQAGARGYRFSGTQGGETAFGWQRGRRHHDVGPERSPLPLHTARDQPHQHNATRDERGAAGVSSAVTSMVACSVA